MSENEAKRELKNCLNELCYRCGEYRREHLGACEGCRWKELKDKMRQETQK